MGTYVTYSLGAADGFRGRFLADLKDFIDWLAIEHSDFPGDFAPGLLEMARDIARRGPAAFDTCNVHQAWLIDRLVHEHWNFCDRTARGRGHDITTSMYKWYRYAEELPDVLPAASARACKLYRMLFSGRSLARCEGHVVRSEDGVFHLSWLMPDEVDALIAELAPFEAHFDRSNDNAVGVLLILEALRHAQRKGLALVVVIA